MRDGNAAYLHVFDENAFRVLAARAFEGPEIESRVTRLNPRKIHLRGAFWAPRTIVHIGFGVYIRSVACASPADTGGSATGLSATDAWR